jgi:YidC/Oxa1 family membrane protein insertase
MQDNKNFMWAMLSSAMILVLWMWFYEKPKMEEFQTQQERVARQAPAAKVTDSLDIKLQPRVSASEEGESSLDIKGIGKTLLDQEKSLEKSSQNRIKIQSDKLRGSINLKGARFDNLYLSEYRETIDKDSKNVTLLAPSDSKQIYFADFGWVSSDKSLDLPDSNTLWYSENASLRPGQDVTLSWKSRQNILFSIDISMDENYMFSISKKVENFSKNAINLSSYGRINRLLGEAPSSNYILHEGPIGVFDGVLTEMQYDDLEDENNQRFESKKSWLGLTDKYWLAAVIPGEQAIDAIFNQSVNNNGTIYNVSFVTQESIVSPKESLSLDHKLFAGAKEVALLDEYSEKYDIELFDRAVDFGWYYFLTKPFFFILKFFNALFGNYGLAILAITVLVKIAMLPLATKSYSAMAKVKKLHPKIEEIKKNNKDNKMAMNKDVMALYKSEKVNPASGCLPMFIQIPVFFSLYKVLFVTIDMRHQPFFGWIQDLSAPDPTSLFNLFGLLPFGINSGPLMIGIWPILMGLTMVLQQKLGPKISDPAQAKVMKFLPFILIFIFAAFPAGLLIYWTWNNILSVTQQYVVTRRIEKAS